ncbi:hypothetical protein ACGF5O_48940 [Streptomyces sp. NPDC048291]|uniref:hypothetical protein n=1 Tax=Streptomyces sp. NPDC048291 TaxID=3365530 RepID=UPI0037219C29
MLRLTAWWARVVKRAERTGQWIGGVERLSASVVEDEHTGQLARDAVAERVNAQMKAVGLLDDGDEYVADAAAGTDWVATLGEMCGLIALGCGSSSVSW